MPALKNSIGNPSIEKTPALTTEVNLQRGDFITI